MRKTIEVLFTLIVGICVGIAAYGSYESHNYSMSTEKPEVEIRYVYIESEPEIITETVYIEVEPEPFYRNLTSEECDLLEQIAFAEARGEGTRGMVMVMNVVLNRVEAEEFGDSIEEVIFASGQFYTEGMTPNVSDECHEAMALVLEGADFSQGALFFNKFDYPPGREPLFQYKNHYFSR